MFGGSLILLICQLALQFMSWKYTPLVAMLIIGFGYSMVATTLWPLISLVVDEKQLATGLIDFLFISSYCLIN